MKTKYIILILILDIVATLAFARWSQSQPIPTRTQTCIATHPAPVIDTSTGTLKFLSHPGPVMDSDNRRK